MNIELAAGTYGVGMSLAPLIQARRMRVRRSSEDVSIVYLAILIVGFALYFAYGLSISNRLLIITNAVSVIVTAVTIAVATVLRKITEPTARI